MSWSINDFRRDLATLKRKYNEASTFEEKEEVLFDMLEVINLISAFEFDRHTNVVITENPSEDNELLEAAQGVQGELMDYIESVFRYDFYYPFLSIFRRELKLLDGVDKVQFRTCPEPEITRNDVLDLIDDFFKHTTKEIYRYYSMFDNSKINFREDRSVEQAFTYYSPGVNHSYFNVGVVGDKRMMLHTIAHERGHLIGLQINNNRTRDNDFLLEIESIFFELIAEDYFADTLKDNIFNIYQARRMLIYYKVADRLLKCRDAALKTFNHMNSKNSPFLLFEKYSNGEDLHGILTFKDMRYTMSYLIALELQEIYQQDRKAAFGLLKKMVRESNKTEIDRVLDAVTPGESLPRVKKKIYAKVKPDILNIKMKNTDN